MKTADGKPVEFVARPGEVVNRDADLVYARPDDVGDDSLSWRNILLDYNAAFAATNPLNLLPAYKLYERDVYRRLVNVFGIENVFILSAGWGLIRASFRLPEYNITFNSRARSHNRRRKKYPFRDFNHLANGCTDDLLFFGGVDYQMLFATLTDGYVGRRVVFFNSVDIPVGDRVQPVRFHTRTKMNWHYQCAEAIAERFESDPRDFDPLAVTS